MIRIEFLQLSFRKEILELEFVLFEDREKRSFNVNGGFFFPTRLRWWINLQRAARVSQAARQSGSGVFQRAVECQKSAFAIRARPLLLSDSLNYAQSPLHTRPIAQSRETSASARGKRRVIINPARSTSNRFDEIQF